MAYTKTVWVADDGKEFDSDQECREHEQTGGHRYSLWPDPK